MTVLIISFILICVFVYIYISVAYSYPKKKSCYRVVKKTYTDKTLFIPQYSVMVFGIKIWKEFLHAFDFYDIDSARAFIDNNRYTKPKKPRLIKKETIWKEKV